jgi:hypothetical protein
MSLKQLLNKTKYNYNLKIIRINSTMFYSFNHSNKILDICMNPTEYNYRYNEIIFFSCSKDNKLIKYYLDQKTDKLQNQYYDLSLIISSSKQNNISANYLTVLQLHPVFNHKLFAGDKKGFLYIINLHINNIDSNNENIKYRKYNIGNFAIILLNFSKSGNLLCIGFETGHKLIYKTNKTFECILNLNEHYLKFEDIEFRKSNNHLLTFFSFLNNKRNKHCIIYTKNHNIIEYAKLFKNEDGYSLKKKKIMSMTIKNTILGLCIHKSENYVIILNERKQIVINNIIEKKTTALIDLNTQIRKIYNIQIDISGLYLAVVCDFVKSSNQKNIKTNNKSDLIIIEIKTSKVKNYILHTSPISKVIFDKTGKYLITGGELGDLSLWRLPGDISYSIKSILNELETNQNLFDNFEIKYNSNNTNNNNSIKNEEINEDFFSDSGSIFDDILGKNKLKNYRTDSKYQKKNNIRLVRGDINELKQLNSINNKKKYNKNSSYDSNYLKILKGMQNNKKYDFWSKKDTIKIKQSINMDGFSKYPEPEDIDDYLIK